MTPRPFLTGLALGAILVANADIPSAAIPVPGSKASANLPDRDRRESRFSVRPTGLTPLRAKSAAEAKDAYELPFRHDLQWMDPDQILSEYTFIDLDQDGIVSGESAQYNKWFFKPDENLIQYCVDQENPVEGNDWLMGPGIHLDGKNIYRVAIDFNMGGRSDLRITIGTSKDPADHKTVLDLPNRNDGWWTTTYSADFTVPTDGVYYVGIYNHTAPEGYWMNLFSLEVTKGISSAVPQQVSDLTVTADENGAMGATVSFVTPEFNAAGEKLDGPMTMNIYRNDELATSIECQPGESATWHDDDPVNGYNIYRVVGVMDGDEGVAVSAQAWVGCDLPEAISMNTLRTLNRNMNVYLDWNACEKGKNGGYFDPEEVTYSIYRGYDRNQMELIAEGLKQLSYTDCDIASLVEDRQEGYFYGVAAVNSAGQTLSSARIVSVGLPYDFPEKESFTNGRLDLNPWLTESLSGDFSWAIVQSDEGVNPIDHDNGMSKFYSYWGGWTDCRLKSPVFSMENTENPVFNVWMLHWNEEDVSWDGGATRLIVEISVDGGEWMPIGEPLLAGSVYGWQEHSLSLSDYKNAETIQIALRGQTDNDWMYYYIDSLTFEEKAETDLMLTEFYGSQESEIDGQCVWAATYFNRGSETAKDVVLELFDGDKVLASYPSDDLQPGQSAYALLSYSFSAAQTGHHDVWAKITCLSDEDGGNDASRVLDVFVAPSGYPVVTEINGEMDALGQPYIYWTEPEIPSRDVQTSDGAEEYDSWSISGFGNWLSVDRDELGSGRYTNLPWWPNSEINQAFMIWAPTEEMLEIEPTLRPCSGDKCFICWMANEFDWWTWDDPVNDDWLISPEVGPASSIRFMVRGDYTPGETYEVLYSSTGRDPEDFAALLQAEASSEWEEVLVQLPENARYFAIRYTASFRGALMVDDISYSPINAWLELEGYDIFRDGLKINDVLVEDREYTDAAASAGDHRYSVAAVYDRGTSNASEEITVLSTKVNAQTASADVAVSAREGQLEVKSVRPANVQISDASGRLMYNGCVEGTRTFGFAPGIYFVKTQDSTFKVML